MSRKTIDRIYTNDKIVANDKIQAKFRIFAKLVSVTMSLLYSQY